MHAYACTHTHTRADVGKETVQSIPDVNPLGVKNVDDVTNMKTASAEHGYKAFPSGATV